jgi:hypothetical protein
MVTAPNTGVELYRYIILLQRLVAGLFAPQSPAFGQSGTGAGSSASTAGSLRQYHSTNAA